jgi:hypothetical protein
MRILVTILFSLLLVLSICEFCPAQGFWLSPQKDSTAYVICRKYSDRTVIQNSDRSQSTHWIGSEHYLPPIHNGVEYVKHTANSLAYWNGFFSQTFLLGKNLILQTSQDSIHYSGGTINEIDIQVADILARLNIEPYAVVLSEKIEYDFLIFKDTQIDTIYKVERKALQ